MHRFPEKTASSRLDGTSIKLLNQIAQATLIILDKFYPTLSMKS
jgi:hypothetical protein